MRIRHDVYFHDDPANAGQLDRIEQLLVAVQTVQQEQGVKLMELTQAVAEGITKAQADYANALAVRDAQVADLGAQLVTALANDIADADTIAAKQAEIDALTASNAAQTQEIADAVATLGAFDLDPSFPAAEPPAEPTP